MAHEEKSANRKSSARMRRLREMKRKKREEERAGITKEQAAFLLKNWSEMGIVQNQEAKFQRLEPASP